VSGKRENLTTGAAVAQHCYNGDVIISHAKVSILAPCKIHALDIIVPKFITVDEIEQRNLLSKFD